MSILVRLIWCWASRPRPSNYWPHWKTSACCPARNTTTSSVPLPRTRHWPGIEVVSPKPAAPKDEFHQPIQRDLGRPDHAANINRFAFHPNQLHLRASRLIEEGRTRRHDTWSAGSGGRDGARAREALQGGLRLVLGLVSNRSAQDERR